MASAPPRPLTHEATEHTLKAKMRRQQGHSQIVQVNQYHLTRQLGKGAFGTVYRARGDGRTLAVKVLRRSLLRRHRVGRTNSALDQLMKEIAVMKKVHHPNCVELFVRASPWAAVERREREPQRWRCPHYALFVCSRHELARRHYPARAGGGRRPAHG